MRPNSKTISVLFTVSVASAAFALEPTTALTTSVPAGLPEAAQTASEAQAARAAEVASGAVGLAPAAVPVPRLVRSASAQARTGADRPYEAAEDDSTDAPEIAAEIDQESAELEDLRQAEESAHVADAPAGPSQPGSIELLPELDMDLATLQAKYDIPIDVNPQVVAYIRFFQSPAGRRHFAKWLSRSHRYIPRYQQILEEEGLPKDTVYLAMIESGFGNFAYSRARASGPWQFIASTGKMFGLRQDFWVDERRDPERSARAAARFLKQLYERTGDWRLAWAGYNAGLGRVYSAQKKGYEDFWSMAAAPGQRVLRSETKGYVPKLMAAAIVSKHPEAFGFSPDEIERQQWTEYTEVEIPSATLLSVLARAAGISEKELIELNPELRRSCTPPRSYQLKIPAAAAESFAAAWPEVRAKVRTTFAGHVIRRGDTLSRIARQYGVPVQGIMELNGLRNGKKLRVGTELLIPRPLHGASLASFSPADSEEDRPKRAAVSPRVRHDRPQKAKASGRTVLRVRSGDTLWSISQKYGVEISDLCRWNGIKSANNHKLLRGSRLVVYQDRG
ncbi:MAG TPA: LysM peptidoglycan-binding domain-containing protein [Anaeromyxobacter sp.]|nr:LysM peptidoglycan-binding domain-containing protein [Anaeromyxobacter sp.]